MRPKEIYEQFNIQEDDRYIFTLMPSEFEEQYKRYVKGPVEAIETETGKITCESYLDFKVGTDQLAEIWKSIQRASIVIVNVSGFKPSVMLELGVALIKKQTVVLICEKGLVGSPDLPFNIQNLGIKFYDPAKLNELRKWLVREIEDKIPTIEPRPLEKEETIKLMDNAKKHRKNGDFDTVLILFKEMNGIEPNNWYIHKEWGIIYSLVQKYDEAIAKLNQALEYTSTDKQKSKIYTELGVVHRKNKMDNMALTSFQTAEDLDSSNHNLYDQWAFLYGTMGQFSEAMTKMKKAVKLNENNKEYGWKLEYYTKRFADKSFTMRIGDWIKMKKVHERPVFNRAENKGDQRIPKRSPFFKNKQEDFERFKKRYQPHQGVDGKILHVKPGLGVFVGMDFNVFGMIHKNELPANFDVKDRYKVGKRIRVTYKSYNDDKQQIGLAVAT
jgi:tetratricopeptide (TPR) repeat protein